MQGMARSTGRVRLWLPCAIVRPLVISDENCSCQNLSLTFLHYFMMHEAIWGLSKNTAPIYNMISMKNKL